MRKVLITLCFMLTVCFVARSQECQWVENIGGNHVDDLIQSINDSLGNIYIFAYSESDSISIQGTVLIPDTIPFKFLAKFNSDGKLLWSKVLPTIKEADRSSIICNSKGDLFIMGRYSDKITFANRDTLQSNGNVDCFLVKFDAEGNYKWGAGFGGTSDEYPNSLAFDRNENICVKLKTSSNFILLPNSDTIFITGTDFNDLYIVFDQNGKYIQNLFTKYKVHVAQALLRNTNTFDSKNCFYYTGIFNKDIIINDSCRLKEEGTIILPKKETIE